MASKREQKWIDEEMARRNLTKGARVRIGGHPSTAMYWNREGIIRSGLYGPGGVAVVVTIDGVGATLQPPEHLTLID